MATDMATEGERCRRCGGTNVTWTAPSPLWNRVMRGDDINGEPKYADLVCIACFIELATEVGVVPGRWRVYAHPEPAGLVQVTPSGRVWDAERWLWVEPTGVCSCGDRFDGDNLCTASACQEEVSLPCEPRCRHISPSPWGLAQCVLERGHAERHAYSPSEAIVTP